MDNVDEKPSFSQYLSNLIRFNLLMLTKRTQDEPLLLIESFRILFITSLGSHIFRIYLKHLHTVTNLWKTRMTRMIERTTFINHAIFITH